MFNEAAFGWGAIGTVTSMLVALFGLLIRALIRSAGEAHERSGDHYRQLEVERDWYRQRWLEAVGLNPASMEQENTKDAHVERTLREEGNGGD